MFNFSQPDKPNDKAFIESFNGNFRAECLTQHRPMNLDDAVRKCKAFALIREHGFTANCEVRSRE
jgi:putative transposase